MTYKYLLDFKVQTVFPYFIVVVADNGLSTWLDLQFQNWQTTKISLDHPLYSTDKKTKGQNG